MSHYAPGFAPVAGREELRSAMHNRFYNDVSRPRHYGFPHDSVTADMIPLGAVRRGRSLRGLGDICDDEGAALGVGVAAAVMGVFGGALSESGRATVSGSGDDAAKSGGDVGRASAGTAITRGGTAVVDAWAAACLSSTRGSTTGATPSESMDSVLARARAEWEATAGSERDSEIELDRERMAREDARAAQTRNYVIAAVFGVVVVGGVVYFAGGRRR